MKTGLWARSEGTVPMAPAVEIERLATVVNSNGVLAARIHNRTDGPLAGEVAGAEAAVVVDAGHARYEIRLPWSALPATRPEPGAVLRFSYIASDNDGEGFKGAIQTTGEISGGKDASLFGDLTVFQTPIRH